jgi:hypothetical protein
MLRLGGYLQQQEKLRPSSPVSSFFRGYEAAADRAYKEGASQLARETLEYNKKKQAEDARLRQEELKRKQNKAKAQAQENALYKYIDDARDGNVPIEQIQQQVNKMYDNSPEYREMLGQPKIQVTNKGRVVMTETGIVTQEKLDELLNQGTIDQDFYDQAVPNIGKEYTFDFARNPQGGFIPIGVKFEQVKKEDGQTLSVNNLISALNSLLRQTDKFTGKPIFTLDQALTEIEKINPNARQMLSGAGAISGEGSNLELNDINTVQPTDTSDKGQYEFNTMEEAEAANVPKGTRVVIGGEEFIKE